MKHIYIESPFIGIGKTTLVQNILKSFPNLDIYLIPEPLNTLYLFKLYSEISSPSIPNFCTLFENWVCLDRMLTYYSAPKADVYIFDRSALAILAFTKIMVKNKLISLKEFEKLRKNIHEYMHHTLKDKDVLYISLTTSYENILKRISKRGRKGENTITKEYLNLLQYYYSHYVDTYFSQRKIRKIEYNWDTFKTPKELPELVSFLYD